MAIKNCIFIGINAGRDIIDGEGLVIIGDHITRMPEGGKLVIGETVFGQPCNLASILSDYVEVDASRKLKINEKYTIAVPNLTPVEGVGLGLGPNAGYALTGSERRIKTQETSITEGLTIDENTSFRVGDKIKLSDDFEFEEHRGELVKVVEVGYHEIDLEARDAQISLGPEDLIGMTVFFRRN